MVTVKAMKSGRMPCDYNTLTVICVLTNAKLVPSLGIVLNISGFSSP